MTRVVTVGDDPATWTREVDAETGTVTYRLTDLGLLGDELRRPMRNPPGPRGG